ncbi:hypothetical protein MTBUT4_30028 [Magnetospirillum sp. UT-4]|nr:hypothetical protein MTBUT4_30028 [Magnetospirillum sp. UT-4]
MDAHLARESVLKRAGSLKAGSGDGGGKADRRIECRLAPPFEPTPHKRKTRQALRLDGLSYQKMVGVRGFEPPAPASRRQCSTRLSYTPVA